MISVVDTNVLISGMVNVLGPPAKIVDLLRAGRLQLAVDDRILDEYADVLMRRYFRRYVSLQEAEGILQFIRHASRQVVASVEVTSLPDPGDTPFLEVVLTEGVPLVSGNRKHFPSRICRGCEILTPSEFIEAYCRRR